ncbi:MAG: hypothetical protein ACFB8W_22395 [Elainellaceae cyanobacterium]
MSRYAVLQGRIQQQLQDLALEYDYTIEQAALARSSGIDAYWIAAGFGLQGFYTGLEKIFEQIARVVDQSFAMPSDRWHQELLEQMKIDVPNIRPAVIDSDLYQQLRVYLGFRHVVRNNYTHRLDPRLIQANVDSLEECYRRVLTAMNDFCVFLATIDEGLSSNG